jgi:hypothetical protein
MDTHRETKSDSEGTVQIRELTLRSRRGLVNQLKEEISRHEARAGHPMRDAKQLLVTERIVVRASMYNDVDNNIDVTKIF